VISAINAAATHDPEELTFTYHPHLNWLPHSFDSRRTWAAFVNYAALACTFWAIVDWVPGKSAGEERAARQKSLKVYEQSTPLIPARLRRLLWVLCLNGALVGVEGIIQRREGTGRLLFLIKPSINSEALSQFGPYHYRANASAYFNLIWPVCLAFWWTLHRASTSRQKKHHLLLVCGLIMAACPIISTSRAGALITFSLILISACVLCVTQLRLVAQGRNRDQKRKFTLRLLLLFFAGTLALGLPLGWKALKPRLGQLQEGFVGREEMYDAARPMARDYPWFGTGPGTFESVFQLYRISTETYWPAQLHNDWLETRITFGLIGLALLILAFVTVLLRWFAPHGIHGGRRFMVLLWLALASALVHARFDFPFQIYSILFLFLLLCAIAFNLSKR
jgi:O-antigen ligase